MYRSCFQLVKCVFSKQFKNNSVHIFTNSSGLAGPKSGSECLVIPFSSLHIFVSQRQFSSSIKETENYGRPITSSKSLIGPLKVEDKSRLTIKDHRTFDSRDVHMVINNIKQEETTGEDHESLNKFKLLLLEVDVIRQDGYKVPETISFENWKELLSMESKRQQRKLLKHLWTVETKKRNNKIKKEVRRKEVEQRRSEKLRARENNDHLFYSSEGNTIFLRVYDSKMSQIDNQRLVRAMMFGINVVVDCGYHVKMSNVENKICAKQLCYMFAENRLNKDPFNLIFCNFNRDTILFNQFKKFLPTLDDPSFPITITQEHYTSRFPRDKLVYLTPHCQNDLEEFNPDDIYIIGAIVDRSKNEPWSVEKAESDGIRMAKFPLDRYLDWNSGTKSLTLNQVLKILLEMRSSGDWKAALKHVPQRKLYQPGESKVDRRQFQNRGTTFQPPIAYQKKTTW